MKKDNKDISRREFLHRAGAGLSVAALALAGCNDAAVKSATTATDNDESEPGEIPTDKMTYRTNPTTGDKVSLLGYGCMRWPMTTDDKGNETIDQEQVNELVDYALAHGVNYFDTSPAYLKGESERATGIALKRHPRSSYYIATKLSNFAPTTWSREATLKMYEDSFREMQVDYIDYLLLHGVGMGDGMNDFRARYIDNGVLDYMLEERKKGRIRNLGFSYHGDVAVFDWLLAHHDEYKWDFVQIQMNYLDWKHAKEINPRNTNAEYLYNELQKRGIPVVIMEPLLGGRLAKVPDNIAEMLKQRSASRSIASWAFRFAGSYPGVLTVLSGMTYMEHLQDNLRSFCPLQPLTEEDMTFLQDIAEMMMSYPTVPCNDCKYCMPCPYGLDIPAIFIHYNKCINEGNVTLESDNDTEYRRARRAFLIGYDRSVPKLRQASHCIGCHQCEPHCPQGIHIPDELQRIDRYVEKLKREKTYSPESSTT